MIDGLALSNKALMIVTLKPFHERTAPEAKVQAIIASLRREFSQIAAATIIPFNLPPIIGLGTGSGFEYQLLDLTGGDIATFGAVARGMVIQGNQNPQLGALFTTFSVATPQARLELDRERLQMLGIQVNDVFAAMQASLGGYYVNDFNLLGRTYNVMLQAAPEDRMSVEDIFKIYVRNKEGGMAPLRAFANVEVNVAPPSIQRYNNQRSITLNGGPRLASPQVRRCRPWRRCRRRRCRRAIHIHGPGQPCKRRKLRARQGLSSPCRSCSPTFSLSLFMKAGRFPSA